MLGVNRQFISSIIPKRMDPMAISMLFQLVAWESSAMLFPSSLNMQKISNETGF